MAPQPAPGTGAPPTGNALSDANSQAAATPFLTPSELATLGTGLSGNINECLWPPQGSTWGIGTGLVHLQFGVPCLFTKSEARAFIGANLFVGGLLVVFAGMSILAAVGAIGAISGLQGATGFVSPITGFILGRETASKAPEESPVDETPLEKPATPPMAAKPGTAAMVTSGGG